jgi:hypothetical protein
MDLGCRRLHNLVRTGTKGPSSGRVHAAGNRKGRICEHTRHILIRSTKSDLQLALANHLHSSGYRLAPWRDPASLGNEPALLDRFSRDRCPVPECCIGAQGEAPDPGIKVNTPGFGKTGHYCTVAVDPNQCLVEMAEEQSLGR